MEREERIKKLLEEIKKMRPKGRPPEMNFYKSGMVFILNFLYDNEDKEIIAGDLAENLDVSTARVAKLLQKLEGKGFIFTHASDKDRRRTVVRLTQKGKIHTETKRREHDEQVIKIIDYVGVDDMETFIRIALKVRNAVETINDRSDSIDKDI